MIIIDCYTCKDEMKIKNDKVHLKTTICNLECERCNSLAEIKFSNDTLLSVKWKRDNSKKYFKN